MTAKEIENYYTRLFPICRSLTGDGVRESLKILSEIMPFNIHELKSGTPVLDWNVPREWKVREAWIKDAAGKIIVDFKNNNLHLIGCSIPVHKKMHLSELKEKLHSLPELPEAIPYLTSYYKEDWGFCLTHNQLQNLSDGEYEVKIDSELFEGAMTYADLVIPATIKTEKEILITSYLCHPSMANNELSGPIVLFYLSKFIQNQKVRNFNYRFLVAPETIGAISYLSLHGQELKKNVQCGFVLTCCGDRGQFTYKKSRDPESLLNRLVAHELQMMKCAHEIKRFFPYGSDERQFCSPGFNLEMGSLMRTMYGEYKEYHTSLDDLSFVSGESTKETIKTYEKILLAIDANHSYVSQKPFGEPMLSRYGVYPTLGTRENSDFKIKMMWILNLSDGEHDLLSIAREIGCSILDLVSVVNILENKGLIKILN